MEAFKLISDLQNAKDTDEEDGEFISLIQYEQDDETKEKDGN